jgi:hypothetical protein
MGIIDIRDPIEPNSFYQEFNEPDRGDDLDPDADAHREGSNWDNDDFEEDLLECPNCNAIWGFDEIQFQQCDACGWPYIDDEDDDDELDYEQIS